MIERAVVLSDGPALTREDLPAEVRQPVRRRLRAAALAPAAVAGRTKSSATWNEPAAADDDDWDAEVHAFERQRLVDAMSEAQGNKSEAAACSVCPEHFFQQAQETRPHEARRSRFYFRAVAFGSQRQVDVVIWLKSISIPITAMPSSLSLEVDFTIRPAALSKRMGPAFLSLDRDLDLAIRRQLGRTLNPVDPHDIRPAGHVDPRIGVDGQRPRWRRRELNPRPCLTSARPPRACHAGEHLLEGIDDIPLLPSGAFCPP